MWLRCKASATDARSLCCTAGAEAMQPHSRRQLEAQNLAKLGMKAKPQQRMGAKIGLSESCCPREQTYLAHTRHAQAAGLHGATAAGLRRSPPSWRFDAAFPLPGLTQLRALKQDPCCCRQLQEQGGP